MCLFLTNKLSISISTFDQDGKITVPYIAIYEKDYEIVE